MLWWSCLPPETAGCQTAGLIGQVRSANSKDENPREGAQANDHPPVTRNNDKQTCKTPTCRLSSTHDSLSRYIKMGWSWPEIKHRLQWCVSGPYVEMHFAYNSYSPVDEDAQYENTTWCKSDLIPIPPDRRTYGVWSYFGTRLS
jgi:hypothetical protein